MNYNNLVITFLLFLPINSYSDLISRGGQNQVMPQTQNNIIGKYYQAYPSTYESTKGYQYLRAKDEISIGITNTVESFQQKDRDLIENGYSDLGYSQFYERNLTKQSIEFQARKVSATVVLVNKLSVSTMPYEKKDDLNKLDYAYQYTLKFYVKNSSWDQSNKLGIIMTSIPTEKRKIYQRNTGMYVNTVINKSKAYNANIVEGDVIVAINEVPILELSQFEKTKQEQLKKSKTLDLTIVRIVKDEPKEIKIPINFN
jgi:membrane-associated protease RseP (regulator of RpoE activity)